MSLGHYKMYLGIQLGLCLGLSLGRSHRLGLARELCWKWTLRERDLRLDYELYSLERSLQDGWLILGQKLGLVLLMLHCRKVWLWLENGCDEGRKGLLL